MHTVYHVAAIHEPTGRVLASLTPFGWILPTFVAPEDVAGGRLLALATSALPLPAVARCLARPHIDRAVGSADITLVADIVTHPSEADDRLVAIDRLLAGVPVVRYQAGALQLLDRESRDATRSGFLRPQWIRAVAAWVAQVTMQRPEDLLETAEIHRAEEQRAVVTFRAKGEVLHFKGDVRAPFVEALATRFIGARVGGLVAPTRAYDDTQGWWLTEHVDGVPLDASRWPAHLAAAEAWVRLQQALEPSHAALANMGVPRLEPRDLHVAVVDALEAIAGDLPMGVSAAGVFDRVADLLATRLVTDVPELVLHFDAAPRNVLWNGARAVFLDLETLCVGPAAVAGELMCRRMKEVLAPGSRQQLMAHAARALFRAIDRPELERELPFVPALADVCLLAARRGQLWNAEASVADEATRRYTWSLVSRDFVERVSGWPSSLRSTSRTRFGDASQ